LDRPIRSAAWLFFAAIMYLILVEAVAPWLDLPGLGNIGFTLVFVLFSILHCTAIEGLPRTARFFALSAIISFLMEEIGVRTGLIFGAYHYNDLLGVKLGHVPILIPLAWFMMIYPAWTVARAILRGIDLETPRGLTAHAVLAALVITAWDVVMDPPMAAAHNWVWEQGGAYFGVPRRNYLGWLLTTFLVYWIAGWFSRRTPARSHAAIPQPSSPVLFNALPVLVYAFFAVRYITAGSIPALQLIALFSMGVPSLIALLQLSMNPPSPGTH
jgi:putative membrane protein